MEVYARRRESPQEDFFGLGPDSLEDNRSNFALRDTFVRVTPAVRRGYLTAGVNLGLPRSVDWQRHGQEPAVD